MRTPIRETPGNFAAQAFQSVTDSERNRLQFLLNQFTGYPVAAFNLSARPMTAARRSCATS